MGRSFRCTCKERSIFVLFFQIDELFCTRIRLQTNHQVTKRRMMMNIDYIHNATERKMKARFCNQTLLRNVHHGGRHYANKILAPIGCHSSS